MRKIALRKDEQGSPGSRSMTTTFQLGTLDQGYWPDGIYTAPTDAALRSDIEYLKEAGFNLTRKHGRSSRSDGGRCDKLGLLVWQDMPSGNNATRGGAAKF